MKNWRCKFCGQWNSYSVGVCKCGKGRLIGKTGGETGMRILSWFEAVQVVERSPEGKIRQWYDGDQVASLDEAKKMAKNNAKEYPGTEYQVIAKEIKEIGEPVVVKGKGE